MSLILIIIATGLLFLVALAITFSWAIPVPAIAAWGAFAFVASFLPWAAFPGWPNRGA